MTAGAAELDAEDAKLVTLARATRARTGAAEGAAVRDDTGRTYVGCTVALRSLRLSALQAAVAAAVASGATKLESAAVVAEATGDGPVGGEPGGDEGDAAASELGVTAVIRAGADGVVRR